MRLRNIFIVFATTVMMVSCGSKKTLVTDTGTPNSRVSAVNDVEVQKMAFLRKVYDNSAYQKNIVSNLSFNIQHGGKDITVPGILHMRRDEVIRLQLLLPILRSEVGRIEFTKDYVLFVDRMHKEYVKARYSDVAFLRNNGINFYSLQSLFWNQLFLPGTNRVGEDGLTHFTIDGEALANATSASIPISLKEEKMAYVWTAERATGLIGTAKVTYTGNTSGPSSLTWMYSSFKQFGSRRFPCHNELTIQSNAPKKNRVFKAIFDLEDISSSDDWDATTVVSSKYKMVHVDDVIRKLMQF